MKQVLFRNILFTVTIGAALSFNVFADTICKMKQNSCQAVYSPSHTSCWGISWFYQSCHTSGGDFLGTQANYKCITEDNKKVTITVFNKNSKVTRCQSNIGFYTGHKIQNIVTTDPRYNPKDYSGLEFWF